MAAGAGVFGAFAFATGVQVELEPKVVRLGFRRLLELHDDVVAVSFTKLGLAHE